MTRKVDLSTRTDKVNIDTQRSGAGAILQP
jgi:hypothetical protein